MSTVKNKEVLEERARNLGSRNGVRLVFVTLEPPVVSTTAWLDLEFYNDNGLQDIVDDVIANVVPAAQVFPLTGGTRLPAGSQFGQVQVDSVAAGRTNADGDLISLRLRVRPIGDYSTYTLRVVRADIDPIFSEIQFKFRPGCFNLNCAPAWTAGTASPSQPVSDYLAKDYDSFKHVLIAAMQERVPGWRPTSEADFDQVLIDLIAADADETSDFQDRVANEGYLATARKRVSLARHARLMDYHIHQGNQATTQLAVRASTGVSLLAGFGVWTTDEWISSDPLVFASQDVRQCSPWLNDLALYHWDELVTALEAGSTEADLKLPALLDPAVETDADRLRDLLRSGVVSHLLIEQALNPETGTVNGRDTSARQLLELLEGDAAAESVFDPAAGAAGEWFVRVHWKPEDRLKRCYCFLTRCDGQPLQDRVTLFHGNLVPVAHGRPHRAIFRAEGAALAGPDMKSFIATSEAEYEKTPWGTLCTLPQSPLAYRKTTPGGETQPRSSLTVEVSGFANPWSERIDLIESEGGAEDYIVETDEYGTSRVRFGNDSNGRALPPNAVVTCTYQIGQGAIGNVGADSLTGFDAAAFPEGTTVWNPLDLVNGRDPEPHQEIVRRVPEAYRARQLRAVTLEDYVKRAQELPQVENAAARYSWTGSWRTVRLAIDPKGTTELADTTRRAIEAHLDAVRLIGEDLEIRAAQYVPLDIAMRLCADPQFWPADLDAVLQQEFSDGYTPDGRLGFFHPDLWTFGQPLYASQLIGRALAVPGVERAVSVSIRRWHALAGATSMSITLAPEDLPQSFVEKLDVDAFEIIEVANDPSALEQGRIHFDLVGGRR
ncbi:MAG: baseplate J/gp47 family protein [Steroidobacterales bacterium]